MSATGLLGHRPDVMSAPGGDGRAQTSVRTLLWHLGQAGAGPKLTAEWAGEMQRLPGLEVSVVGSEVGELGALCAGRDIAFHALPTFRGGKGSWRGKAAAALALARLPLLARDFGHILRSERIDVAICTMHAIWDAATVPALARSPARSVLMLHDAFLHPGDWYPGRQTVMHRHVRSADALVVLSDHVRDLAVRELGYPAERVWKVPHGAFRFAGAEARPARHPRGARPLSLIFFGRIVAYKGLDHLLRACRLLQERGRPVRLTIAGSGSLDPYAALLDGLQGIELHNRWLDEADIAALMTDADLAVLPYVEASQSGVAGTAYGAGRPVVATPTGGLAEQVVHGTTGLLARDMSVDALAEAIDRFAGDPDLLDACADGALRHAEEELSWRRGAEAMAEVVSAVMASPRRGR